jgi:UDP-glucose 4-epimerase
MKKVLVTGGAGFVGTNLVKRLLDEGHEVVVVDNFTTGKITNKQEGAIYLEEDIKNRLNYSVIQPYLYFDYDVVFHLAAIARIQPSFENPKDYFETNANGTFYLAQYSYDLCWILIPPFR